jgi:hypothetical protein
MSRRIDELLKCFTPDTSGLDRDALLFAAGRASARPNRLLLSLVACLTLSQAITLAAIVLRPTESVPAAVHDTVVPTTPAAPEMPPPVSHRDGAFTFIPRPTSEALELPVPKGLDDLVPDDPPLRASRALSDTN